MPSWGARTVMNGSRIVKTSAIHVTETGQSRHNDSFERQIRRTDVECLISQQKGQ